MAYPALPENLLVEARCSSAAMPHHPQTHFVGAAGPCYSNRHWKLRLSLLHAGIPVASKMLEDLPGYGLYKAMQMPFGAHSADFACTHSYTSKRICELPGNLTVGTLLPT